ncbi:MAG: right-handed parallel beta-helix repeat-containing protein [Planctomycetia bacterium]|nr:right-handed parallel beta-helix repeat-containing protein [Planctomycetia bacterium]
MQTLSGCTGMMAAILATTVTLTGLSTGPANAAEFVPEGFTSTAISAALAKTQPGDEVRLPEGTYALTEGLRVPSGRKVVGAGEEKTRLTYTGTSPVTLVALDGCEDVELAHVTIDGENNPLVHQGIGGGDARRLSIHHVTVRRLNAKTFGPHGMLFGGTRPTPENPAGRPGMTDSRITHCTLEEIGLDAEFGGGIRLAFGCDRNEVSDNRVDRTGRGGIFGDGAAELDIRRNRVTGSGGEGLGIELWGGCPRSVIEDNDVDHWISIDGGEQTAVRRNRVQAADGSLKGFGIEIIARDVVVSDNVVDGGAIIGLSVSNARVKNNVLWARNTVRDCVQWGAQFQGESGGIAHHFFHGCRFEKTRKGDSRSRYPGADGHGFRTNGRCRGLVFEDCIFRDNGGYGVQLGGPEIDVLSFRNCRFIDNAAGQGTPPDASIRVEFLHCTMVAQGKTQPLPDARPFSGSGPEADFESPERITAGKPATFRCISKTDQSAADAGNAGVIVDRLWDFGHGIPAVAAEAVVTFPTPGTKRVALVVWDREGRGALVEKQVTVEP